MHLGVRPGLLTLCLRFFSLYYFSPGEKAISFSDSQRIRRNIKISRFEEEGREVVGVSATSSVSSLHRIKLLRHWEVRVKPSGGLEEGRDRGTPRRWGVVGSQRGRKNGPCLIVKASRGFLGMAGWIFRNANLHREAEIYLNMDSPPERF